MNKVIAIFRMLSRSRYLVRRQQTRFVIEQTRGKIFPVVVDIGSGTAPYKKIVAHERYIGIDIEDRGGVTDVLIEDVNKGLSLSDNTADMVLCTEVLEHVKKPDAVITELFRILKKGGTLILTTPMVWPVHEAPNDFYRFTNFGLEYLLREAGFRNIFVEASNGYFYSMLQLALIPLRKRRWLPVVFFVNIVGYIVGRIERNRNLALVYHVKAIK